MLTPLAKNIDSRWYTFFDLSDLLHSAASEDQGEKLKGHSTYKAKVKD